MRDPTFSRHVQAKNGRVEELSSGESEWESCDGSLLPPSSLPPPPSLPLSPPSLALRPALPDPNSGAPPLLPSSPPLPSPRRHGSARGRCRAPGPGCLQVRRGKARRAVPSALGLFPGALVPPVRGPLAPPSPRQAVSLPDGAQLLE